MHEIAGAIHPSFGSSVKEESSSDEMAGNFKHPVDLEEDDYNLGDKENDKRVPLTRTHTPLGSFFEEVTNIHL